MKKLSLFFAILIFTLPGAAQAQAITDFKFQIPDGQKSAPPRFDRKFKALAAADGVAYLWDETQTLNCLRSIPGCRETNPLYGPHPSAGRLYGLALAVDAGYFLGSWELRRHGPERLRRLWFAGAAFVIEGHIQGIAISKRR